MFPKLALLAITFATLVHGQQVGTLTAEVHPTLTWEKCTASGGCTTVNGEVVLDANWRWVHNVGGSTNCYSGNTWDATLCPDDVTCATNCALDGADYEATYGITTSGNALTLDFVTDGSSKNVGSRVYLMASTTEYEVFNVLNQEFTFDVDVANLPCGLNGALYFSQMDADGGVAKYPANKAGAQYGTGYCDSQCPRDLKFIAGQANVEGWTADSNSANSGTGGLGACCNEMDVWEANSISAAFTPHPCSVQGLNVCNATTNCGATSRYESLCDPDGCDFNSYRMGNTTFYGPDLTVDTTQKFTVVTQFLTSDNTSTGTLSEIRRIYVQNGVVIQNSQSLIPGVTGNAITEAYCDAQKIAFNNTNSFDANGGFTNIGEAFSTGVVLVLSLWDDYAVDMLWLDSDYPTTSPATAPGVARGTCATTSGVPATVESTDASASVTYSNIKFGDIGSTFTGTSGGGGGTTTTVKSTTTTTTTKSTTKSTTTTSTAPTATQTKYGQCGGQGYTGPTVCASGSTCDYSNAYYSQCL